MGYYIQQLDTEFFIKNEDKPNALKAIQSLKGHETITDGSGRHFSWVNRDFDKLETLEAMLDEWRWQTTLDQEGNIINLTFTGEKYGDCLIMFNAIAPFVKHGSFINIQGEDCSEWTWQFFGNKCMEVR